MSQQIYFDNASATKLHPEVLKSMLPFLKENYGNPDSPHQKGQFAKKSLKEAKEKIADLLDCSPENLLFTNSGSQANEIACSLATKRALTTTIEHSSIFKSLAKVKKVEKLAVDNQGFILDKELPKISQQWDLITINYANQEIGTIQDIEKINHYRKDSPLHLDACQAVFQCEIKPKKLHTDLMTINSAKIHGPQGIALLYIAPKIRLSPPLENLENENLAAIVGFSKALEISIENKNANIAHFKALYQTLINAIKSTIFNCQFNSPSINFQKRLNNIINFQIPGVVAERLVALLSQKNVFLSTRSACESDTSEPSSVLSAIGLTKKDSLSSLRLSFGLLNNPKEVSKFIKTLTDVIKTMRTNQFKPL